MKHAVVMISQIKDYVSSQEIPEILAIDDVHLANKADLSHITNKEVRKDF